MRKTLLTKKAINELVKAKDTDSIIKLYELEKIKNPFDSYVLNTNFTGLTYCQKEALKEQVEQGKTFGLAQNLYYQLKELLGLGRITRNEQGKQFFIDYSKRDQVFELDCPF